MLRNWHQLDVGIAHIDHIGHQLVSQLAISQPLIIFIDPEVTLHIEDDSIPVLVADPKLKPNLKDYMRDAKRQMDKEGDTKNTALMPLTDEQIEAFEAATIKK